MNGLSLNNFKSDSRTFVEEGVLFYPQLLEGEDLARVRAACENVRDQYFAWVDEHEPEQRNSISMREMADPRWHRHGDEHWKSLMEIVADPRCLGPVEQLFGGPSLFRTMSLFFNPRFESSEGVWHRDLQFIAKTEDNVRAQIGHRPIGVQLQIALVDNDDIEYVPFSASRYDSPEEYHIRCADDFAHHSEEGMPNAMRVAQRAGDAVAFNPNGLHRGRYYVDKPRLTLMLTYLPLRQWRENPYCFYDWMSDRGFLDKLSRRSRAYYEDYIEAHGR